MIWDIFVFYVISIKKMSLLRGILVLFFVSVANSFVAFSQSPVSVLDTSHVILNDNSDDYSYIGPHFNASSPYNTTGVTYRVRFNRGSSQNIRLDGFTHASSAYYVNSSLSYFVKLKRIDSVLGIGDRQLLFYQRHDFNTGQRRLDLSPGFAGDMEQTLSSSIINRGTDNVFGNAPSNNINNIERIDVVFPDAIVTTQVSQVGILILERGGNDPFKVAAITSLNQDSVPTSYSTLISVPVSAWGMTGINPPWVIMRNESYDSLYRIVENIGSQSISGVFLSFSDLNLSPGDSFFGYSIFPSDVDTQHHNLIDPATFPLDTDNGTGQAGGLDIISIPGVFHPDNVLLNSDCFEFFSVRQSASKLHFSWSASVSDFETYYVIEMSLDGDYVLSSDTIKQSQSLQSDFSFSQINKHKRKTYYRLKRVDPISGKECKSYWKKIESFYGNSFRFTPLLNPFNTNLDIRIEGMTGEKLDLIVIDALGNIVLSQQVIMHSRVEYHLLPFYSQPSGLYYLIIQNATGERKSQIVIKK